MPVVRAFDRANRNGTGVPQLRGTLDLIFARQPRPTSQEALPFQVWDGTRLVPVFHSQMPDTVEPVRSIRPVDIPLQET